MQAGADILLFNVFAYGLDVLQSLAEDDEIPVPIMAHPAVSGAYSASSYMEFHHHYYLESYYVMLGLTFHYSHLHTEVLR